MTSSDMKSTRRQKLIIIKKHFKDLFLYFKKMLIQSKVINRNRSYPAVWHL